MSPHILSAAVAAAGANRLKNRSLWEEYSNRAKTVVKQFTVRDTRFVLQGHAEMAACDPELLQRLASRLERFDGVDTSARDACRIAIALAKLGFKGKSAYSWITLRVVEGVRDLDPIDLATVANAYSQSSFRDARFLETVAARFRALAQQPQQLTSVSVTLTLNSLALCSHFDAELWKLMLDKVVKPRIHEFNIRQLSLITDSIARCPELENTRATLLDFAEHFLSHGLLEEQARVADITRLARAFAQLQVMEAKEFNLALAESAMQQLSAFTGHQLAELCSALVSLPSSSRDALFAVSVRHAVLRVLHDCGIREIGLLLGALTTIRMSIPQQVADHICDEIILKVSRSKTVGNNALSGLFNGLLRFTPSAKSRNACLALQRLAMQKVNDKSINLRAVSAIMRAHANFRLRDASFL